MLRNEWTDAWDADDAPATLGMPLQNILIAGAFQRFIRAGRLDEMFAPVGQVVGNLDKVRPTRDVVFEMVDEYIDTMSRLDGFAAAT
jgi:NAD(P)H-dependent flavin oxidoreductase YrpB (nitropropane dioxygenase family)